MIAKVTYGRSAQAWQGFNQKLDSLIADYHIHSICEIGGGANPALPIEYINQHMLEYSIIDSSAEELRKAPEVYKKVLADVCTLDVSKVGKYDLVFSRLLAEHVKNGEQLHRNIYEMLSNQGIAFHFFPTLFALPFLVNRLIPDTLSSWLVDQFAPRDRRQFDKFPAYYSWCQGPTRAQFRRFEQLGFQVIEYLGFFGHEDYYRRLPGIKKASAGLAEFLARHPFPYLTSYAYVILQKP